MIQYYRVYSLIFSNLPQPVAQFPVPEWANMEPLEWWFSVVDVCAILTESADPGAYWRKLKQRLKKEGSEVVTFCHGLKLVAPDGKFRKTDCANTEGIFRTI